MVFKPEYTAKDVRWGRFRFALGMAQMAAAVVALTLLVGVGVTPLSLAAVVVASSLTSLSVMLFGRRRRSDRRDHVTRRGSDRNR